MEPELAKVMNLSTFVHRLQASGLSRWELGDPLGIHPHELGDTDLLDLRDRPIRVIIELARRLDMHPADLVYELDPVLTNRRQTTAADPSGPLPVSAAAGTGPDTGALTVLTALATAEHPLSADQLAHDLGWELGRVHAALTHAHQHPGLAGPMALRRVPPHTYTLTARLDILQPHQRKAVLEPACHQDTLGQAQANALYAVLALGRLQREHHHAEHRLRKAGLISGGRFSDRLRVSDDVLFSLRYTPAEPDHPYSAPWWTATQPRPSRTSAGRPPKSAYRRAIRWREYATANWDVIDDYYGQHPRPVPLENRVRVVDLHVQAAR